MFISQRSFIVSFITCLSFALLLGTVEGQFRGGRGGPGGGRGGDRGGFGRGGSRGGFGRGGSRSGLSGTLQQEAVQQELKLTEDQKSRLLDLAEQSRQPSQEMQELMSRIGGASDEEREAIRSQMEKMRDVRRGALEVDIQKVLSPGQFERLKQLSLQNRGVSSLREEDVAADLRLTEVQREKIQGVFDANDEARRNLFTSLRDAPREERMAAFTNMRGKSEELQRQRDAQVLAVLTPEQRQLWEKKLGPPLPGETTGVATAAASIPKLGTTSFPTAAPRTTTAPIVGNVGSLTVGPDGTEIPHDVVASFGAGPETTAANADTEATEKKTAKTLSFNFRFAPWADVLTLFADAAGLTLDLNDLPPGTFNYYDKGSYTPTEALNIINGYLLQKGYILVRRDRFAVVLNIDNGIPPNLVPDVPLDQLPERASNELVRVVMPLEGKDSVAAQQEVQQLLGPQGKAVAMTVTNSLVVTGLTRNVTRIHALLASYVVEEEKDVEFKAFTLKYVAVADVESIIRDLLGLPARGVQNVSGSAGSGGRSTNPFMSRFGSNPFASRFGGSSRFGGGDPRRGGRSTMGSSARPATSAQSATPPTENVALAIDERTNTMLVSAPSAQLQIIEQAITTIDVSDSANLSGGALARRQSEPYLEVYETHNADAGEVTKTLDVLHPGTVVNEDRRYNRIHIFATAEEQREIASLIQRLDGAGGGMTVAVIPTGPIDPTTISSTLQTLFGGDLENAPSIVSNPGHLIVRGTADQVMQIKTLLNDMGAGSGTLMGSGSGRVRTIPLGGRDAFDFLRLLQTVSPNPIRIRTPQDSGPIKSERVPSATDPVVPETERDAPGSVRDTENSTSFRNDSTRNPDAVLPTRGKTSGNRLPNTEASLTRPVPDVTPENTNHKAPIARLLTLRHESVARDERHQTLFSRVSEQAVFSVSDQVAQAKPPYEEPAEEVKKKPSSSHAVQEPATESEQEKAEIVVEVQGNSLVLISEDEEALDRLENLIYMLAQQIPNRTGWTVFYLRSADATEASLMLEQLFPGSSVTSSSSSSGILGGLSRFGSNVMQSTGLSAVAASPDTLQILPETRLNALFVAGPPDQVRDVENVLKVLDASELPVQLRDRAPRMIPVEYADATQVAEIVRNVYAEEMGVGQQKNAGPGNPLAAMFGGGRGSSGRSPGGRSQAPLVKLTLGVDTGTNQLIVSASDSLFRQVEALVQELDRSALDARQTVRVVPVQNSNGDVTLQALTSLIPKLSITTTTGSASSKIPSRTSSSSSASRPSPFGGGGPGSDQLRQMIMQRMSQRLGQGGGTPSRGGSSFRPGGGGFRGGSGFRPSGGGPRPGGGRGGR